MINHMPSTDVETLMERLKIEAESYRIGRATAPDREGASFHVDGIGMLESRDSPNPSRDTQVPTAIHLKLPDLHEQTELPNLPPVTHESGKLSDLLVYQDRAFIHAAYWAVLHRAPDEGGAETYLKFLRGGASKIEILEFLHDSQEGRSISVSVRGLSRKLFTLKLCKLPIFGRLVRLVAAFWELPGTQRRQRASEGYMHALIEKIQSNTERSIHASNHALHELSDGLNRLTTYAASKASRDSVNTKASGEEMWRLLDEVHSSLQMLQSTKASIDEVSSIRASLSASSSTLKALEASKADLILMDKAYEDFTHALRKKPDRDEVSELVTVAHRDALQASASLTDSKVDRIAFEEFRESLALSLQTKADRHELTALTNYFVSLLETRLTKQDFASLEQSFDAIRSRAETDRALVKVALEELSGSLLDIRNESAARLETALHAGRESLTALARSKADLSALESAHADARLHTDHALHELRQAVTAMSANKADRTALEAILGESRISIGAVRSEHKANLEAAIESVRDSFRAAARSKADQSALESVRVDARLHTDHALGELRQALSAISANKADRTALEVIHGECRTSIDAARNEQKANLEAAIESVRQTFQAIARSKADLSALDAARADARLHSDDSLTELRQAVATISANKADTTALATALGETRTLIDTMSKAAQEALQKALAPVTNQTRDVKRNLIEQERRLSLLLDEARKRLPKPISTRQIKAMLAEDDHLLDAMYASFEDIFRGTREDIKQRQSVYLPYIHAVKAGVAGAPVVDIGCGRGEWLELLGDAGLQGRGVDLNRIFLARCGELNLDVIERDALEFLREQAPNSLGAITSFHLIEHLPHKTLIAVLDAALRALRPGGVAIFETPNPRNLQVGSCNFYLDPTHKSPLPPDLMRYLFEARGFVHIEIKELHPCLDNRITDGAPGVNEILNRFLSSAQDYAVIGKKPK
jgi:SAM-dependent methyltransferase